MSHLFFFSRYQTKCVIEFLFRQLMTSWTLRFIFDHPLKQWPTGRKRGKDRNTKIWISSERKELFRWNKKHFSYFLKGYHLVKKQFDENSRHKLYRQGKQFLTENITLLFHVAIYPTKWVIIPQPKFVHQNLKNNAGKLLVRKHF